MKRIVLVTGGAGGIGQATCAAFGENGDFVIALDVDRGKGLAWEKSFLAKGYRGIFQHYDLTNADGLAQLVRSLESMYGAMDVLINNAGIGGFTPLNDLTVAHWDHILNVNLRSMVFLAKECSRGMKKKKSGRIVNISSTRFHMSEPGSEAYAASKGGIVALTHALSLSLANTGITVNCISPGWIEHRDYTNLRLEDHTQHPSGRVGTPEDIARLCLFLTEPDNDFINGENIIIDGGMTRKMIYLD
jgi:NAD(P)-dependent dehydrogenase (short-subunit alcohol dehydrogenase family)